MVKKYEPRHKKDNSRRAMLRKKRIKKGRVFVKREVKEIKETPVIIKISLFRRIINFIKKILWTNKK